VTKLLERAIEAARRLSPSAQDEIARAIIQLAGEDDLPPVPLSAEELKADEVVIHAVRHGARDPEDMPGSA
jgi:hypothetical protein